MSALIRDVIGAKTLILLYVCDSVGVSSASEASESQASRSSVSSEASASASSASKASKSRASHRSKASLASESSASRASVASESSASRASRSSASASRASVSSVSASKASVASERRHSSLASVASASRASVAAAQSEASVLVSGSLLQFFGPWSFPRLVSLDGGAQHPNVGASLVFQRLHIYKRHRQTGGGRRTGEWSDDYHTSLCLLDGSVLGYRLFLRPRLPAASPFGIDVFVPLVPCCSCRCDGWEGHCVPSDSYVSCDQSRSAADSISFSPLLSSQQAASSSSSAAVAAASASEAAEPKNVNNLSDVIAGMAQLAQFANA